MVAIEDQPPSNPSSASCSPAASLFNSRLPSAYSSDTAFYHNFQQQQQQRPPKSRAGYRSLASSTNRGGGGRLSYSSLTTESRPSITRSFAVAKEEEMETPTSLSPTSSFTTASTRGSLKCEKRAFGFGARPL